MTDRCVCAEGYVGDGYHCLPMGRICGSDEECGKFEKKFSFANNVLFLI